MTDLMCTVSSDIAGSRMGVTIVDLDLNENDVLFSKDVYHRNFFNGQSTQRHRRSLAEDARDWAIENGHLDLADEIKDEFDLDED